jgi:hypothetical protein
MGVALCQEKNLLSHKTLLNWAKLVLKTLLHTAILAFYFSKSFSSQNYLLYSDDLTNRYNSNL